MQNDKVLVLEDDLDLLESLDATITELLGRGTVGAQSYEEMVALRSQALACSVALLDINLGPRQKDGLDAYEWLRREGFEGRILFLTGHARTHPLVARVHALGEAVILQKPLAASELILAIRGVDGG